MRRRRNGRRHLNNFFFWLGCSLLSVAPLAHAKTVAFLGDSITTGAVTNPVLTFDKQKLWKLFRGEIKADVDPQFFQQATGSDYSELTKPVRLWPTVREYFAPSAFAGINLVNAFSTVYLDTEQYSWAYMVARARGYEPAEILIAAQDGARMEAGIRQVDRVLNHTGGRIPEEVFVFFTGNDICGPSIEMTKSSEEYASELSALLRYLMRNGTASPGGSDIYVLGFMGMIQLTTSPEILDKKIVAHGKETTCREFDSVVLGDLSSEDGSFVKEHPEASWFMAMFPNSPVSMCPTVFNANPDRTPDQKAMLANRIRSMRKKSAEVVGNYQKIISSRKDESPIRFHYMDATGDVLFGAKDIAEDCFHLSIHGQHRVAETVKDSLSNLP